MSPMGRLFDSDWGLRVLALLMAVALWIFVGLGGQQEITKRKVELDVELRNPPTIAHWLVEPGSVDVVLEGPAQRLERLDMTSLHAFVDVDPAVSGSMATVSVSTPEGIKLDEVEPVQVRLIHR